MTEESIQSTIDGTDGNPWLGRVVHDAIEAALAARPDHAALIDGDTVLTFADLAARRDALASALSQHGVGEGTHVAVYMRRSWEHAVLLFALWRLGAVAVALNTAWEADELDYALNLTDAEYLVTSATVAGTRVSQRIAGLGLPERGPVSSSRFPSLRAVVADDPTAAEQDDWRLQSWLSSEPLDLPAPPPAQDSVVLFTSGSTDRPKAVVVRQESLLGSAHFFMGRLGLTDADRFLGLGQYFHAGGIVQLLGTTLYGTAHYIFDGFQPEEMAQAIHQHGITATAGFDLVLTRLLRELDGNGWPCPINKVGCAPGMAVHDRFEDVGATVVMVYAMSEAANMVSITTPAVESERGRMSNGYPLPGVTVRICDEVSGAVQPPGTPGEICFKGWNLFSRYYKAPEQTEQAIDEDGFFHTGDYGWVDEEGRLYYRGRYSMMIKTGGENVSETEVENFLVREVPGVVAAAVVGAPDERWGEAVVAFVELAPGTPFDPDALREACRGKIAGYKIPKRFYEVADNRWPTSPMGKLMKQDLRAAAGQPGRDRANTSAIE
ncbi:class I adenylate-forming enzyme family protein [Spirillospora sp. CA-255316]